MNNLELGFSNRINESASNLAGKMEDGLFSLNVSLGDIRVKLSNLSLDFEKYDTRTTTELAHLRNHLKNPQSM